MKVKGCIYRTRFDSVREGYARKLDASPTQPLFFFQISKLGLGFNTEGAENGCHVSALRSSIFFTLSCRH